MDEVSLHRDVALGRRAQQAFDSYLKEYFQHCRERLFENFMSANLPQENVLGMKAVADALMALETAVQTDIENGQLAAKELENYQQKVMQ